MKAKLITTLALMLLCLTVPGFVQAQDNGAPDSLYFVVSPLEAGANDTLLTLELYCFNDGNTLAGIQSGFRWESDNIELLTAVPSPAALSAWNQFFLYDGNLVNSNANNRASFAGFGIFTANLPQSNTPKLLCTYTFRVSNWDVNSSIYFDSTSWDEGTEMFFNDDQFNVYYPVWGWGETGFTLYDVNHVQCDPPIITCPTPEMINLCAPQEVCIDVPISGADNVVVTGVAGATWSNGQVCFTADATTTYNLHVVASVDCGEQTTCDISVPVTLGAAPVITCPTAPFEVNLCGAGEVCVPIEVTGATTVMAAYGTWSNGQLCFNADTSGTYTNLVMATNNDGCGGDECEISVIVTIGDAPIVNCQQNIIPYTTCTPGQICVELAVTGADSVTSDGGAVWVDGLLCFNAEVSDLYIFNVVAYNDCGTTPCEVSVDVQIEGTPTIACPTAPVESFLCEPGEVCVPIEITGANSITPSLGTYSNGQVCFQADTAGTYAVQLDATNDCGTETCNFSVVVAIGGAPVISCPPAPVEINLEYADQVCVTLPISGASQVTVDGATWNANALCFQADTTGTYSFSVTATSDCGQTNCEFSVVVDITPPCVNIMLSDTLFAFTAFEGDMVTSPVSATFAISSSVDSIPFDWTLTGLPEGFVIDPTSGSTPTEVTLSGNPMNLGIGHHLFPLTIASLSDRVCDPFAMATLVVDIYKQPSADTVIVADVPAVPGMQVSVPITFTNSCFLTDAQIELAWANTEIYLDSVSYAGSAFMDFTHGNAIDNDGSSVFISESAAGADPVSPASGQQWANLHFTVSPDALPGTYGLSLFIQDLQFTRDCGDGPEVDIPEFIPGGILVDSTENYVCGWVVTPNGFGGYDEIEAANVEMWSSYPLGEILDMTTSGHNGAFAFDEFWASNFDLRAYADGFYPGSISNIGFGEKGLMIVLYPLADLNPSDMWVDYYCESNTLLGVPLPVGSVVEAFDPQGTLCGRQIVTEPGVYRFMPVYRDSSMSVDDEGATTGDILTFRVNGQDALATGDLIYPSAYDQIQVCLEAGAKLTKTCDLMEGWNLISWNINTESDFIDDLLLDHMDCIDVVLGFEQGGLTYDPDLPQFSTLWYMDHLSGYWVKVSEGCQITLEIEGLPVLANTPIPVTAGWNLVSYLADGPLAPVTALASIHDNLLIAYGAPDGIQIYQPGQEQFNTLTEMNTCLGYWVKVTTGGDLVYPSDAPAAPRPEINQAIVAAARLNPSDVTPTTSWMNLYSTDLTLDGENVQAGADIAAYTMDNKKVGGFTVTTTGEFGFMPVYADDAGNQGVTGLNKGDKFYLTVDGVETNETFTWTTTGDRFEVKTLTAKGGTSTTLPGNYLLGQNYPNPFNPSTTISFTVPAATQAKIEIFNVLGKLVAVPYDGFAQAGENSVVWDGQLSDGQTAASGIYFYRLSTDSFSQTRKMMLLK